jgi:hypothetical protein
MAEYILFGEMMTSCPCLPVSYCIDKVYASNVTTAIFSRHQNLTCKFVKALNSDGHRSITGLSHTEICSVNKTCFMYLLYVLCNVKTPAV